MAHKTTLFLYHAIFRIGLFSAYFCFAMLSFSLFFQCIVDNRCVMNLMSSLTLDGLHWTAGRCMCVHGARLSWSTDLYAFIALSISK